MKVLVNSILFSLIIVHFNLAQEIEFEGEPENLGPNVNSSAGDFAPKISPDGRILFFTRDDHPENLGDPDDDQDIWYSELQSDGSWGPAKNIGGPLNNASSNFVSSISPDGNMILLGNAYNYFDGSTSQGVSIAYRDRKGWTFPKKQSIEKYENINDYVNYFMSQDGRVLLMATERKKKKECYGDLDIYVSFKIDDNQWTKPKNIGPTINTPESDAGIFLASDGVTMFFSSEGHGGYGDADIFITRRLDDTWTNWSKPINLGPKINTDGYESNFTVPAAADYAYFASTKDSYGDEDIFRIKLPQEAQPEPVVLVKGRTLNSKTKEPIQATITYELLPEGTDAGFARSEPVNGAYNIVLPHGFNYGFRAYADGYYAVSENLNLKSLEAYEEVEKDLFLSPVKVGEVVRLNNIFFETAKAELKDESIPELKRVIKLMEDNPSLKIELGGHTDSVGKDENNMTLSQARAQAVVTYLTKNGVSGKRLTAQGYGETLPIADNETEEGRELNRRVEFKLYQ